MNLWERNLVMWKGCPYRKAEAHCNGLINMGNYRIGMVPDYIQCVVALITNGYCSNFTDQEFFNAIIVPALIAKYGEGELFDELI